MTEKTIHGLIDGVPAHVHPFLLKMGWKFHHDISAWRKHVSPDSDQLFSPHPADHDRCFADALEAATRRANAGEDLDGKQVGAADNQRSAQVANHDTTIHPQNYATPGDTGTDDDDDDNTSAILSPLAAVAGEAIVESILDTPVASDPTPDFNAGGGDFGGGGADGSF